MAAERMVHVNGVDLCVETFGDPDDPAILLIGGQSAPMDWWEDEFCARLAAGLRYVVRYDHRDTGRSVSYPAGAPPYTGEDLSDDAAGLIVALGVGRAHLVGVSMGGGIAQEVAAGHPDRVASLTLIATSPVLPGGPGDLPPPSAELRAYYANTATPDWTDRAAVIDYMVEDQRRHCRRGFDEAHVRELAARIVDRTADLAASMTNHPLLNEKQAPAGRPPLRALAELTVPTLVIHGTADPLFPYRHGEALASEIPGARLLALAGVGHEVPPRAVWDEVIPALLRHTSGGWDEQGDRLATRSLAAGDPTGWFDRLYGAGAAGEVSMPWDRTGPHPLLVHWARARRLTGAGRRAVVVGCGLGADAEYVAGLGYDSVAFDISGTAVRLARERHPGTRVEYLTADLLAPPAAWSRAFDLVVEIITVQALPDPPRRQAIVNVGRMVAAGGTLFVIAAARPDDDRCAEAPRTPPWPLARAEIDAFAADGLTPVRTERVTDPRSPDALRWVAEFRRAGP
jgi:pimeloyl-ACP methyl ester carboxylesterase/SAM-dependent methyltransferase